MNKLYLENIIQVSVYTRKEHTSTSYYRESGTQILPKRLSISKGVEITKVTRKGRAIQNITAGQMIANYTKKEQSPLKQNYPFKIRTQIWAMENYPLFIGYGSLAISNEKGIINRESDLGDLIVFFTMMTGIQYKYIMPLKC